MDGKTISVVIVSYNNPDVIDDCLRSIRANNDIGDRLEVIVVEQSPDDSLYRTLSEQYPEITVLRAENRGFGAGNNAGAEQARGDILFFLNPDTVVEEPVFAFAEEKFRENPRLGLTGVRLISAAGENISYNMMFPYGLMPKLRFVLCRKRDRFDSGRMYIEGADLIIRREAFEKAGKFDEKIFMYCEETDLCHRVREAGYEVRYYPDKKIRHLQGKCTDDRYPQVYGKQIDSFVYVCGKHGFDARKWLKREVRYQQFRAWVMGLAGKKEAAGLSRELAREAAARIK